MMWPQPLVLLSTIWIRAVRPARSRTSQPAQSRVSLLGPVAVRTTLPSSCRADQDEAQGEAEAAGQHGEPAAVSPPAEMVGHRSSSLTAGWRENGGGYGQE